jgi:hypothetical protein
MARLALKRRREEFPPTPVPPPPLRAFRVARRFAYDGRVFEVGDLISLDSPVAQQIHAEYPEYMRVAQ